MIYRKIFKLTAITVQDIRTEEYTAYFAQLPGITSRGKTEELAVQHLWENLNDNFQKTEKEEVAKIKGMVGEKDQLGFRETDVFKL